MYLGFKTFPSCLDWLSKDYGILELEGTLENIKIQVKDLLNMVHISSFPC